MTIVVSISAKIGNLVESVGNIKDDLANRQLSSDTDSIKNKIDSTWSKKLQRRSSINSQLQRSTYLPVLYNELLAGDQPYVFPKFRSFVKSNENEAEKQIRSKLAIQKV